MTDISDLATNIKVLCFDVGGTVIDWHTGISSQLAGYGSVNDIEADWMAVTKAWRTIALETTLNSKREDLPRGNIDGVHRATLDGVLAEFGLDAIPAADRDAMAWYWHNLEPWPDSAKGHARLKTKFLMSTLTILSLRLIMDVSHRAPFHWDSVITCEMLDAYKLDPLPYREAPRLLQVEPDEILMVAAHNFDLEAAAREGLKTAFIHRPTEWGEGTTPTPEAADFVDVDARDLNHLAELLGC
jgi:2-haloacid dehalogenase